MKKLVITLLSSVFMASALAGNQASDMQFVLPYNVEVMPEGTPEWVKLQFVFLNDLHERIFKDNITEEQALEVIKTHQERFPDMFATQLLMPPNIAGKGVYANIVDRQIWDINELTELIALFDSLSDDQKTEDAQRVLKEFIWMRGRMKVVVHLFEQAGIQASQAQLIE